MATILAFKVKYRLQDTRDIINEFLDSKSYRNHKLYISVRRTIEKWGFIYILAVIFFFVNLKVNHTK